MKRFSLITRLGKTDIAKVNVLQCDSSVHELDFLDGDNRLAYGLGQALAQLASLGLTTPETAVDLALLAGLVNAADTRVSRDINAQGGWTREIDLYLPVSDPDLWSAQADHVGKMLRFLTGDRWRLFFRQRPKEASSLSVATDKLPLHGLDPRCARPRHREGWHQCEKAIFIDKRCRRQRHSPGPPNLGAMGDRPAG